MLSLAATFGFSIVVGISGTSIAHQPGSIELAYPLDDRASGCRKFVGGCAFAMVFNCPIRSVLSVEVLSALANELRLGLHDAGMMLGAGDILRRAGRRTYGVADPSAAERAQDYPDRSRNSSSWSPACTHSRSSSSSIAGRCLKPSRLPPPAPSCSAQWPWDWQPLVLPVAGHRRVLA